MRHRDTFVDCGCGCSKLVAQKWDDEHYICLSMWTMAAKSDRLTLSEAIRVALRAIFKRILHEDYMVLDRAEAERLGRYLSDVWKAEVQ